MTEAERAVRAMGAAPGIAAGAVTALDPSEDASGRAVTAAIVISLAIVAAAGRPRTSGSE